MEDPRSALASLSLTHVHYDPSDPVSYVAAWLALVPQGLCIMYVTLIWATREVEIGMMFAGQMSCEVLNFGLKRWIREERPKRRSIFLFLLLLLDTGVLEVPVPRKVLKRSYERSIPSLEFSPTAACPALLAWIPFVQC